jgi:alpha-D-xyloside xylohydrolase
VDLYVFAGPTMLAAVQRYNLFAGGGCLPPRWGLGPWYRCHLEFTQEEVLGLARGLRQAGVSCDVIGLEPGWQTHAYPCTFVWSGKFPDPAGMIRQLAADGFKVNLWTHAFIHPDSPLHPALQPRSGDYCAFTGLVPDLASAEVRQLYADQYERDHVALGVSGYKLDECDNSDYTRPWSFPEASQFPSGLDGEQMHSAIGLCYQEVVRGIFRRRNQRTLGQVRSSHALAAPYPLVLYSDLYDHRDFLRGVVNCGFSGLLWSPEVRHAASAEDLIRRLQSVVLSPQALINAWYIRNPPWRHWDTEANNRGERHPEAERVEAICRDLLSLRASLVPYLYAAFHRYWAEGIPPFRALVLDWPEEEHLRQVDDQWGIGDRLLVAPVVAGQSRRPVALPAGIWYDFYTGAEVTGGGTVEVETPLERIPLYVRADSLLPLAGPALHAEDPVARQLTVRVYGTGANGIDLIEDDGASYDYESGSLNHLQLRWDAAAGHGRAERQGTARVPEYEVIRWERFGG